MNSNTETFIVGGADEQMNPDTPVFTHFIQDDPEINAIFSQTCSWLEEHYPGLSPQQHITMAEAIFAEALNNVRRSAPDIISEVLARYGLALPAEKAEDCFEATLSSGRIGNL